MSNQVSITDLLTAIGSENISLQYLTNCMTDIKEKKGESLITFCTKAITPLNVVDNTGVLGIILWVDRDLMRQRLDNLKAGNGLTYDKLLEQRNELLAALEEARTGLAWYQETYPEASNGSDDEAMERIDVALAKAKGGAA